MIRALSLLFLAALAGAQGGGVQQSDNVLQRIEDAGYTYHCLKFDGHSKTISPAYEIPQCWGASAVAEVAFSNWVNRCRRRNLLPLVEPLPPPTAIDLPGTALEWTDDTHPLVVRAASGLVRVVKGTPVCWSVSATNAAAPCELMDVPAIQETAPGNEPVVLRDPTACVDGWMSNVIYGNHCASRKYWSCADPARVLLLDVAGKHWHCVKFGGTE